jgi:hypothetical protein
MKVEMNSHQTLTSHITYKFILFYKSLASIHAILYLTALSANFASKRCLYMSVFCERNAEQMKK